MRENGDGVAEMIVNSCQTVGCLPGDREREVWLTFQLAVLEALYTACQ